MRKDDLTRFEPVAEPPRAVTGASIPQNGPDAILSAQSHPVEDGEDDRIRVGALVRGRFELESMIGHGSTGTVYKALDRLHREMQDRDPYVAIKILGEEFRRHPKALITLQRETRKAQALTHPNIVNVHNFDRDGSVVYMTMELLDGETLRNVIDENARGGLAPEQAVPMIRSMASALAYAHENGIVHSDFKPGNVFLTLKKQIKVLDFGVARAVAPDAATGGARAAADVPEVTGMTPAYASLEMLEGQDPTPADDVFALATVAYELLTGRHPFDSCPPDEFRLARMRSSLPSGLSGPQARALRRAFSARRESRHANAGEFLKEFDGSGFVKPVAQAGTATGIVSLIAVAFVWGPGAGVQPEVAFEDLPPQVQQRFEDAVREGETALGFGNAALNDAFHYFSQAHALHPGNPRAVAGLEAVADGFLASLPDADAAIRDAAFELLYCQDHLRRYAPIGAACRDLLGAERCATIAASCPSLVAD